MMRLHDSILFYATIIVDYAYHDIRYSGKYHELGSDNLNSYLPSKTILYFIYQLHPDSKVIILIIHKNEQNVNSFCLCTDRTSQLAPN